MIVRPLIFRAILIIVFAFSVLTLVTRCIGYNAEDEIIRERDIMRALATGTMRDCYDNKQLPIKNPVRYFAMNESDTEAWRIFLHEQNGIPTASLPDVAYYERNSDDPLQNFVLGMRLVNGSYCLDISGNSGGMEPYVSFAKKYY